ncbi:MAG: peptidylprolyl isomerase, partial [Bacteroidota bacterium]|nr:peptidylprolyl isomerase [Bacteroidota bacterium]
MKKTLSAFFSLMLLVPSYAQTLFTYGNNSVTKGEFVRAFNKNTGAETDRKKALKEYLQLYINFKLKVQAAYDAALDKDARQQYELQNFRKQIADNIINDEANIKALVQEAFERSYKEIHLQQVFVEVPQNGDTMLAYKKIQSAYQELKEGKDFGEVAQEFSTDEVSKQSKGDVGFITVFTLPYQFENEMYGVKSGAFSLPFRSKIGYHIFKNAGERNASGSRSVAQILVALPPNASIEEHQRAAHKVDSLYRLLASGADFGTVATAASNDVSSSSNRGILPEFTVGTYNSIFESVAFSLKNKGEVSKPFETEYGYHILQLIEAKTPPANVNDPT